MHNGFVTVNGEKMSKSLGNISLVKDLTEDNHGEVIRLVTSFFSLQTGFRLE